MFIRGSYRLIVGAAFDRAGLAIHYERCVQHEQNRPMEARHLDYELFVFFVEPSRPLGAPSIEDVIVGVLETEGVEGMANGRRVVLA
jgi:hypothetical protein